MDTDTLVEALDAEHCGECHDQNTCDISKAYDEGLYLWAAHLLIGATECPQTEAEYIKLDPSKEALDAECKILLECPHVACPECNAIVWTDEDAACGNCRADVKVSAEESEG